MMRMNVSVDLKGGRRYAENLEQLGQIVSATAANIEGEAKQSILTRSSQGNEYFHAGGKVHWSAAKGNPPNSDTGNLANSIKHKMTGPTSAEVNVGAEYSIPLELGWISANGKHQGPFPFMVPAVRRHENAFVAAVKSVMRGKRA
jgi:hypothetical protein